MNPVPDVPTVASADDWPSPELRDRLESISWGFHTTTFPGLLAPMPAQVWHCTGPEGITGILRSGHLWLSSTFHMVDRQEIHWGNAMLIAAALSVNDALGNSSSIDALLHDHKASLFLNEPEAFVACFAEVDDSPGHWIDRRPDGAALVFDAKELAHFSRLGPLQTTGLMQVLYDDKTIRRVASEYFLRVIACAQADPRSGKDRPELAQWLMEPGVLSFFVKRRSWAWEKEWRLVKRAILVDGLVKSDPRRIELDIRSKCSLREVVLGPRATPELEKETRAVVAADWPGIPVRRSAVAV